ncbi:10533_t:CDS:2 [Ambispora gerdemannii]|uniref:10533_t:CDS:1 n=1 Tax=Ambispora gerdemannii TaxID=144530 RepID=A0A9N9EYV5_9GLOM|nr:10533_t:CDS:2 [Ambispora gerdemannii]
MPKETKEKKEKHKRRAELGTLSERSGGGMTAESGQTRLGTLNERLGITADPPPPMITIDIPLEYPENNIVYFPDLLKEAGVWPPTPPRHAGTDSDSDSSEGVSDGYQTPDRNSPSPSSTPPLPPPDSSLESEQFFQQILQNAEANARADKEAKSTRSRKKTSREENYDTSDPFIDDSELAPAQLFTGEVRPSVEGFFVWKGPLVTDASDGEDSHDNKKSTLKKRSAAVDKKPRKRKVNNNTSAEDENVTTNTTATLKPALKPGPKLKKRAEISDVNNNNNETPAAKKRATIDDNDQTSTSKSMKSAPESSVSTNPFRTPPPPPNRNGTIAFIVNPVPPMKEEPVITITDKAAITPPTVMRYVPEANKTPGKSQKTYHVDPINHEVQLAVDLFKVEIAKESFAVKNRFPPNLKPHLLTTITRAYELNEFNENFFKILTNALPYNKFTVTRLCKRTLYPNKITELEQQRERLFNDLRVELNKIMPGILAQYELMIKAADEHAAASSGAHTDGDIEISSWTPATKNLVWKIIQLEMDITLMRNDLMEAEDKTDRLSEHTTRKLLYQKLVACWPPDWMSTQEISRMYSALKLASKRTTTKKTSNNSGND